jgi:flavodoxin long chain
MDGDLPCAYCGAHRIESNLSCPNFLSLGADTERSGTGWDELYYRSMSGLDLTGKKVAVFGLGDSVSYAENYADAAGELHDVFEKLGCKMFGYVSTEGYLHEDSKSIRGDKFCGLLLDMVNQEELTEERVEKWVVQLESEGFLDEGDSISSSEQVQDVITVAPTSIMPDAPVMMNSPIEAFTKQVNTRETISSLEENSTLLDESIASHDTGFTPHTNPVTGKTMWTSVDGTKCYVTEGTKVTTTARQSTTYSA